MVVVVVCKAAIFGGKTTSRSHVGFTPDDGFDPCFFCFAVKLDGSKHVSMIGHRYSGLAEGFNLLDERLDLIRAVEQTVLGVKMKMHEGRGHGEILGGRGR